MCLGMHACLAALVDSHNMLCYRGRAATSGIKGINVCCAAVGSLPCARLRIDCTMRLHLCCAVAGALPNAKLHLCRGGLVAQYEVTYLLPRTGWQPRAGSMCAAAGSLPNAGLRAAAGSRPHARVGLHRAG